MKYLNKLLLVVGFAVFIAIPAAVMAKGSACAECGSPTVLRSVKCTLVRLHFTQPSEGAVAIRLYDADGAVIYDRYSKERAFVKQAADNYAICASLVRRAAKVTITRCTPEVATPKTYEGDVLEAFRESEKTPVVLP